MQQFEILYGFVIIQVTAMDNSGQRYKVQFPNEVPDIIIERLPVAHGESSWDTVPAGNPELGTAIGRLLEHRLQ